MGNSREVELASELGLSAGVGPSWGVLGCLVMIFGVAIDCLAWGIDKRKIWSLMSSGSRGVVYGAVGVAEAWQTWVEVGEDKQWHF